MVFVCLPVLASLVVLTAAKRNYVLITGSSDGIGRETAKQIALKNSEDFIILHGRNQSRCENVTNWLARQVPSVASRSGCVIGEFRNLSDVVKMADTVNQMYPNLSIVLLNAGIFADSRKLTQYGLEETFQVNHLAHFLLIHKLIANLRRNAPSRIVVTSSLVHLWVDSQNWDDYYSNKTVWNGYQVYGRTKLYNVMMTDILAENLTDQQVTANSLHPGHWQTKLSRWGGEPVEGVRVPAFLAVSPRVRHVTGKYFNPTLTEENKNPLVNRLNKDTVWKYSADLLRNFGFDVPELGTE